MIVTLAGHVDHGKTSIVRALTGIDTDRLAEEKRRGLTIDLGFAYADIDDARIGFVDVPGHHRFVHNMVAGVAGHQYALLVVAADDGVMPQSREHLQILHLLGLTAGVVVVNKTDRVEPTRVEQVQQDIRALIAGSFLEGADIVPLSCETGTGIDHLRSHLSAAVRSRPDDRDSSPFRLAIDRAFTLRGSGVVVTGTVVTGTVAVEDRLVLGSTGKPVRVRGLHVQDTVAPAAAAGDRAAINLAGAASDEVARGDWLLDPTMREPVRQFAAELAVVDDFPRVVRHNAPAHVYHAASHSQARILLLASAPVAPGTGTIIDVACGEPLQVKVGDRVVFRDHDLERTLGGGRVLDLGIPATRRRQDARQQRLTATRPGDAGKTLAALAAWRPVAADAFARHWNLRGQRVKELARSAGLQALDGHLLHPNLVAESTRHIEKILAAHHQRYPHSGGLGAENICTGDEAMRLARRLALAAGVEAGALRTAGGRYAIASHQATIPPDVRRLFREVETLLDSIQPPSLGDIAKRLKRSFQAFERDLRALPAFGLTVRVSDTRHYLPTRLLELAEVAIRLDADGPFTVRQFRDATGVGRNAVIEVLEHFDAKGLTRRTGNTRRVVGERSLLAAP